MRLLIPDGPPETESVRWWALLGGEETTGVHPGRTASLVLPAPIEQLGTVVVAYLDAQQAALDVRGSSFGSPGEGPTVPPSTTPPVS